MRGRAYGITDLGRKRPKNEDFFAMDPSIGLFIVADGLGGRMSGDKASYEATQTFIEKLKNLINHYNDPKFILESAFKEASKRAYEISNSDEYYGAMTTFTALFFYKSKYYIVHVGDTRAYLLRANRFFYQITEDDTQAQILVRKKALSPKEAETHPSKHVLTKALGHKPIIRPKLYVGNVMNGDKFLLCSDGLYIYFSQDELRDILKNYKPKEAVEILIKLANDRGGEDNITGIAIEVIKSDANIFEQFKAFLEGVFRK
ncbi:MAG: protein phosphatase 2C domain-containing protein [candidate division WOR-3 bacterium]|jgi:protein phosphatase